MRGIVPDGARARGIPGVTFLEAAFPRARDVRLPAAQSLVSTDYPRRGRGAAETRLHGLSTSRPRRRRDPSLYGIPTSLARAAPPPLARKPRQEIRQPATVARPKFTSDDDPSPASPRRKSSSVRH